MGREPYGRLPVACGQQLLMGDMEWAGQGEEPRGVEWNGNYFLHYLTKYGQGGGETRHRSSVTKWGRGMFEMLGYLQSANH